MNGYHLVVGQYYPYFEQPRPAPYPPRVTKCHWERDFVCITLIWVAIITTESEQSSL